MTGQVAVHSTRQSLAVDKRGDLTIGGLTLSGGGGGGGNNAQAGEAAAGTNSTGKAGGSSLTLPNGLTLGGGGGGGGNGNANANANANAQSSSLQGFLAAAEGASAKNQTGQAAPQASGAGQGEATTATPGEATAPPPPAAGEAATPPAGEPKAVAESEQFSEEAGITVDSNGNLQNLGGDLGITKVSDTTCQPLPRLQKYQAQDESMLASIVQPEY